MLRPAVLLASRPGPVTLVTAETCTSKLSPPESPHGRVGYHYAANWTPAAVELTSTGKVRLWAASALPGHSPASALLPAPPSPSPLRPLSRVTPGYTASLAPPVSRREEEGCSSCWACPGHRAAAPTPPEDHTVSARIRYSLLPSPFRLQARPPGLRTFGVTSAFAYAAAR